MNHQLKREQVSELLQELDVELGRLPKRALAQALLLDSEALHTLAQGQCPGLGDCIDDPTDDCVRAACPDQASCGPL